MFKSVGRFSCAFRWGTISFCTFFHLLSITHLHSIFQYLRIVDKYSVNPPTTYVSFPLPEFIFFNGCTKVTSVLSSPKSLKGLRSSIVKSISRFHVCLRDWTILRKTFIFFISEHLSDLWATGGSFRFRLCLRLHWRNSIWSHGNGNDRPQSPRPPRYSSNDTFQIQINTTFNVARMLGLEAAKRKVKAYIKIQLPFYDTTSVHDERGDIKPSGPLGTWWHESMRVLASIEE